MPRKDASQSHQHGVHDVIGIVLCLTGLLLLCALLSYDPKDLSAYTTAPNNPLNNWIGPVGAHLGLWLFWAFGLTAYMVPALLIVFGLGYIVGFLSYLPRRWIWGAVLLVCCMGLFSMFETELRLHS